MESFAKFAGFSLLLPSIAIILDENNTPAAQLISMAVIALPIVTIKTGNPMYILPHLAAIGYFTLYKRQIQ